MFFRLATVCFALMFSASVSALSFVTIQLQVLDSSEQRDVAQALRLPVVHSEANPDGTRSMYVGQFRDLETAEAQLALLKRDKKLNWPKLAPFVVEMFPSTMGKPKSKPQASAQPKPVLNTQAPSPTVAPQNSAAEIERQVSELKVNAAPQPAPDDEWKTYSSAADAPSALKSTPADTPKLVPPSIEPASEGASVGEISSAQLRKPKPADASGSEITGEIAEAFSSDAQVNSTVQAGVVPEASLSISATQTRYGVQAGAFKRGSNYRRFIKNYSHYPLVCRQKSENLNVIYLNVFEGYSKAKAFLAEVEADTELKPYIVTLKDVELTRCES